MDHVLVCMAYENGDCATQSPQDAQRMPRTFNHAQGIELNNSAGSMSVNVDDFIEVNIDLPQRRGLARPAVQAGSWPLFQVTRIYRDEGTFHAVSHDVPTEIPILSQDCKSGLAWRRPTSIAPDVCSDVALFARVCYSHQTECEEDMHRVNELVEEPDATDVATKLLEKLLTNYVTLSSSPTFSTAAKKLIKWAEVSPDSLRRIKLPDTAYGFNLIKCDESRSGYKGVTQCGDINADRAWRVYIAKVHVKYTDDAVEGAVWFAQAYEGRWDQLSPQDVRRAKKEARRKLESRKQRANAPVVKTEGPVATVARLHGAVINLYSSSEASDSDDNGHASEAEQEAGAASKQSAGGEVAEGTQTGSTGKVGEMSRKTTAAGEMAAAGRTAAAEQTAATAVGVPAGALVAARPTAVAGAVTAAGPTTAGEQGALAEANAVGGGTMCQGGTDVWKGALQRKRKRQHDAKNASTLSTFVSVLDCSNLSGNHLAAQLIRHFAGPIAKLDEFLATASNRDELRQYVEEQSGVSSVTARRFREAIRDRYGDANSPTTDALANGMSRKRQRLEIAARSSTFDDFVNTFGSDGSVDEFKQYIRMQASGDLLELDDYLVTDSDRQELFEQLVTAGQPTVSALDEFRTSLLGRYGQPCVDDFPRLVWE